MAKQNISVGIDDLAEWASKLASAIDRHDDDDCPRLLLDAVGCLAPHDLASIVAYGRGAKPVLVHDTFVGATAKHGLTNFINGTYVLNPVYTAFRRGLTPGVYRLSDLAPDGYFDSEHFKSLKIIRDRTEEAGYVTESWPRGMEEILVAMALPDDGLCEVALYRAASHDGFSEAEISKLRSVEPVLSATMRRHWQYRGRDTHFEEDSISIPGVLEQFSGGVLSPREREIAEFMLKGHSGHSIGSHLGISTKTVKTHRQNLYGKLGIATQYELFSLFLKSIPSATTQVRS